MTQSAIQFFLATMLIGCTPAAPPLEVETTWTHDECGVPGLSITATTSPGAHLELQNSRWKNIAETTADETGLATFTIPDVWPSVISSSKRDDLPIQVRANQGGDPATEKIFPARSIVRKGRGGSTSGSCSSGLAYNSDCEILTHYDEFSMKADVGATLTFEGQKQNVEKKGWRAKVKFKAGPHISKWNFEELYGDSQCDAFPIEGVTATIPGNGQSIDVSYTGTVYVGRSRAKSVVNKALRSINGEPLGPPEATGKTIAILRNLIEGPEWVGPAPKRLSDISEIIVLQTENVQVGSCGKYKETGGTETMTFYRFRPDIIVSHVNRVTGELIAQKRIKGKAGECRKVGTLTSPFTGKVPQKTVDDWIASRVSGGEQ